MPNPQQLITENLNIWTAAIKKRGSQGRGSSKKIELHGIKKLRELILELAVRGLLVPQNPNDEPASALLEKIAAEKEQLLKDKKIQKQKPLPELSDTTALPLGWTNTFFGDIALIERGGSPRPIKSFITDDPKGLNWIKIGDTEQGGKYITSTNERIRKEGLTKTRMVYPGDFLLTNSMSFGRPYISKIKGCIHDGWLRISPPESIDKDYLYILLSSPFIIKAFKKAAAGAVVLNLNADKVREVELLIPPEAEQPRIVAKVDELMALCDQLEQQTEASLTAHQTLVETLLNSLLDAAQAYPGHASCLSDHEETHKGKTNNDPFQQAWQRIWENFDVLFVTEHSIDQLKQTILQLAVMGKLVPQNPNDEPASVLLERISAEKERLKNEEGMKTTASEALDKSEPYLETPESWGWCRLGNLAKFIDYRGKTPTKISSGVRLITAKNIRFGYIDVNPQEFISKEDYSSWMTRGFPRVGDILFTPEAPLGNVALVELEEKFALAQRAICFQMHVANISSFVKLAIMAPYFQNQLILNASGMTATGIKASKLKEILIPIPPEAEQPRIVAKVDELMALCDSLKDRIRESQTTQLHLADAMAEQALSE